MMLSDNLSPSSPGSQATAFSSRCCFWDYAWAGSKVSFHGSENGWSPEYILLRTNLGWGKVMWSAPGARAMENVWRSSFSLPWCLNWLLRESCSAWSINRSLMYVTWNQTCAAMRHLTVERPAPCSHSPVPFPYPQPPADGRLSGSEKSEELPGGTVLGVNTTSIPSRCMMH